MDNNYQQTPPSNGGAGFAVASMVLGIVALVFSCCIPYLPVICAIIAVALAGVALKKQTAGKGMAIAGLVCGIIALVPSVIVIISGAAIVGGANSILSSF